MPKNINFDSKATFLVSTDEPKKVTFENLDSEDIGSELLVRFYNNEEIAKSFIETGSIKVNTIEYVRKINQQRKDSKDSALYNFLIDYSHCSDDKKYIRHPISVFAGKNHWIDTTIRYTDILPLANQTCVFCLSHLHLYKSTKEETIKEILIKCIKQLKREENEVYAVVIFGVQEFLNILKRGIQHRYQNFMELGKVKYVDYDPFEFINLQLDDSYFNGSTKNTGLYERAVFSKSRVFKDECELRVAFENSLNIVEYDIFDIGSIKTLSFMVDLTSF